MHITETHDEVVCAHKPIKQCLGWLEVICPFHVPMCAFGDVHSQAQANKSSAFCATSLLEPQMQRQLPHASCQPLEVCFVSLLCVFLQRMLFRLSCLLEAGLPLYKELLAKLAATLSASRPFSLGVREAQHNPLCLHPFYPAPDSWEHLFMAKGVGVGHTQFELDSWISQLLDLTNKTQIIRLNSNFRQRVSHF